MSEGKSFDRGRKTEMQRHEWGKNIDNACEKLKMLDCEGREQMGIWL